MKKANKLENTRINRRMRAAILIISLLINPSTTYHANLPIYYFKTSVYEKS